MKIDYAKRVKQLPPYLFAEIDKLKAEAQKKGVKIISLGIGDPDIPTPGRIIKKLQKAAMNPANHQYPSYEGMLSFRKAVADWYKKRFKVKLDPASEVLSLIGSKEGIGHIFFGFLNPGDIALVPDPGYPVYGAATIFAGGKPHFMPLLEKNGFLPDYSKIPVSVLKKAKLMFINYPNNPTGASAGGKFFAETVRLAKKYNIIVCHDNAYSEIAYDGYKPMSFLEVKGAKDVGVEFHSLSKTYNMTGWRAGFAVGNADILNGLGFIKQNLDSGIFQAVQEAGIEALKGPQKSIQDNIKIYQERRDVLVAALKEMGWEIPKNLARATFYLWVKCPKGYTSKQTSMKILKEAGVIVTPGVGFGKSGEGYVRFALTVKIKVLKEVIRRLKKVKF